MVELGAGRMWVAFVVEGVVQLFLAWSNVFTKLAQLQPEILVAYRYALGSATLLSSLALSPYLDCLLHNHREDYWPRLTWRDLIVLAAEGFLSGFLGASLPQNLNVRSLTYLDANLAAVMSNCTPLIISSITLPIIFRKELLELREGKISGKLKLLGVAMTGCFVWATAVCVDTFYEGPVIFQSGVPNFAPPSPTYLIKIHGVLISLCADVSTALALLIQADMHQRFPNYLFNITVVNLMGAIQATAYALHVGHSHESWKLGFTLNLLAVTYLGVVCSGIMMGLTAFCMQRLGPEIVGAFNPVMLILSTGPLIVYNGKLRLGSVVSGLVMIVGWSAIIWAKMKEQANYKTTHLRRGYDVDIELGGKPGK